MYSFLFLRIAQNRIDTVSNLNLPQTTFKTLRHSFHKGCQKSPDKL